MLLVVPINSVTPSGVEHWDQEELVLLEKIPINSVTPSGVEHNLIMERLINQNSDQFSDSIRS